MASENFPPTKISDETFYWLISYETKAGRTVDSKSIGELLGIKTSAARMQVTRAKKRLETAGATFDMKAGGDEEVAENGKGVAENGKGVAENGKGVAENGKGGAGKKRAASAEEAGLDGMMNAKKKVKGKKVKVEEAEEE